MPVLSCGGMRYQYKWQDVAPEEIPVDVQSNLEACIHRSLELGINHIETARGYGSSEMQLGWVLPKLPREKLIIQTKVGPSADPAQFIANFEKSMAYLKLDYVDLLSFHGVNTAELLDQVLRPGGCLEAARKLQRDGRAKFIGFSTHAPTSVIVRGITSGEFDYVNLHWYFVNPLNLPAVEEAAAQDMGVFIISPSDKGGRLYNPPQKLVDLCNPLTPIQFNNLYCLQRSDVHTLSIGAARPSDFDEHVDGLKYYDQIDQVVPPIEKRLTDTMEAALGRDWLQSWFSGVPEVYDIPHHVNVLEILRLWNYASSLDLVEWGRSRYNMFGEADHWFPGRNPQQASDVDLSAVLANSPWRDRILETLPKAHALLGGEAVKRLSQS